MSSNLLTVVGEKPRTEQKESTIVVPVARTHTKIIITCASGMQVVVDQRARTFEQTAVARVLADVISSASFMSGEYWTIKPDPPLEGEDVRIYGPRANGSRRLIEMYKVQIEPAE